MHKIDLLLAKYRSKMRSAELPNIAIQSFEFYFRQLVEGETGSLPENELSAVTILPDSDQLDDRYRKQGSRELAHTVMIKLNGGLGTSMGLEKAKSLLQVSNGLTFLDIIANQTMSQSVPLVLMNSFATRKDTLAHLQSNFPDLDKNLLLSFTQHKIPKVRQVDFLPAEYHDNPSLEWCPPGHGDIYTSLLTNGLLESLLKQGYRTAFISNSDNLGASLDPRILGYFVSENYGFMMEVADRTPADKKGGHLANWNEKGNYVLRESAQCPEQDLMHFHNIKKHRFFNTNNLWIDLKILNTLLDENNGFLKLPLIRNSKSVNPTDPSSDPVFQLETAMGAAISIFPDSQAIRVPRNRFLPVKTTDDLLIVTSDVTKVTNDFLIQPIPDRNNKLPRISLDPRYYRMISGLDYHFPFGPPSLVNCDSLSVIGRFRFGRNVTVLGETELISHSDELVDIEDGTILEGSRTF